MILISNWQCKRETKTHYVGCNDDCARNIWRAVNLMFTSLYSVRILSIKYSMQSSKLYAEVALMSRKQRDDYYENNVWSGQ